MRWISLALAATALAVSTQAVAAQRYAIDPAGSDVSAKVAFFGLASRTAHFPRLSGGITLDSADPANAHLDVTIDALALTAPDPVTLARLKGDKFFWVERYPTVTFTGRGLTLTGPMRGSVAGTITARGISRPAVLAVTFAEPVAKAGPGRPIELTGRMTIDRRAFGMTAYSLIVGRKVAITIRARLVPS